MENKIKRKVYFLHPSSQLKYMLLCVLPAFAIGLFCLEFLYRGTNVLEKERQAMLLKTDSVNQRINIVMKEVKEKQYPSDIIKTLSGLLKEMVSMDNYYTTGYFHTVERWARLRMTLFSVIAGILILITFLSMAYSHRVAGPLYRVRKSLEMMVEGKDMHPIAFRKHDEFKELAAQLEALRKKLASQGYLK